MGNDTVKLLATAALVAGLGIGPADAARGQAAMAAPPSGGTRETLPLADGWRFRQDKAVVSAELSDFADAEWQAVSVPHTWNRVGYYLPDPASHVNTRETVEKAQGPGWYRLRFTPPASWRGRRAWLEFDAASRTAEVWLNGVRLGAHDGGFSRFRLDATAPLRPGLPNLLVVKTDNSQPALGSPTADVLPLAGDFFVHGGLYRPVRLVATAPVHLEMLDAGSSGVFAFTRAIDGRQASVAVRAELRNDGRGVAPVNIVSSLVDADGRTVAARSSPVSLKPGQGATVAQDLAVAGVRLWRGVEDPYLYRLVVEVQERGGAVLDRVEQGFGVRQMRFDPERGFFLNGRPYRLRGVGLHQDREGKGWAASEADVAADVALIREMGANSIRLTHYQHDRITHDLADRYGLILWDEIPLVSVWALGKSKEASPGLKDNARQQLRELIRQNYNHPSVAVWGIANEVDFGGSLPAFLTAGEGAPDPLPLLNELDAYAKQEDPTRPTAQANCCEGRLFAGDVDIPIVAPAADLAGANRYFGWYYGKVADLGPHLEAIRRARPAQPLAVTEYGAGGATTIHSDDPRGGPPDSRGRAQPEEYETWLHEQTWPILESKPYLWGTWLWNSFDFATTVRAEGDAQDINTKGLVTYDRKTRKDAFYYYKANWSDAPTVHINGRRYLDRAYRVGDVTVYSNAPQTELALNGRSLGSKAECPHRTCVWEAVRLDAGENALVATGSFADGKQADRIAWRVSPEAAAAVRIDSGALVASPAAPRFGSDAFFAGGTAATLDKPADYGKPKQEAVIDGAANRGVAATYRKGAFRYRIPLDNGRYEVALTFVEPGAKPGERRFDVIANGRTAISDLDVVSAAGAPLKAVVRGFPVRVVGGALDLQFQPRVGEAIVSAIEIGIAPSRSAGRSPATLASGAKPLRGRP